MLWLTLVYYSKLNRLEILELDDDGQGLTTSLVVPVHAAIAAVTAVQLEVSKSRSVATVSCHPRSPCLPTAQSRS